MDMDVPADTAVQQRTVPVDTEADIVSFQDVSAAAYRVRSSIRCTPCGKSESLSEQYGMEVRAFNVVISIRIT